MTASPGLSADEFVKFSDCGECWGAGFVACDPDDHTSLHEDGCDGRSQCNTCHQRQAASPGLSAGKAGR